MKIVIPGGTGQLGHILARAFHARGDEVVTLGRSPRPAPWRVVRWDSKTLGDWAGEVDGADAVINLAGRSVNCRYNAENRRQVLDSRVASTRVVGQAIARARRPPRAWLQASTATIYAHRLDAPNDERDGQIGGNEPDAPPGWRFSVEVARAWEQAVEESPTPGTRRVILRTSMVMSPDSGGVFGVLLGLVRRGLGGRSGSGDQFVSWIHEADFVAATRWLVDHDSIEGPVNMTSPNPLPNHEFMRELRAAWGIPIGLPATEFMLTLGTFVMRTESELVLKSRRVVPGRLIEGEFSFQFPDWAGAARDLCQGWRQANP